MGSQNLLALFQTLPLTERGRSLPHCWPIPPHSLRRWRKTSRFFSKFDFHARNNWGHRPNWQMGKDRQDRTKWRNWGETGNRRKRANRQNLTNLALFLNPNLGFADEMLGEIKGPWKDPPQGIKAETVFLIQRNRHAVLIGSKTPAGKGFLAVRSEGAVPARRFRRSLPAA